MKSTFAVACGLWLASVTISSWAADTPSFELRIQNHRFEPATLTIPADTKIALRVHNLDATPEEFESHALHREKVIPANSEAVIYLGPLKPSSYPFVGEFHESTANGVIVVK